MAAPHLSHALILAGGTGKKCWPYSVTWNKAALPVGAQPLISRTAHMLQQCGIQKITVLSGYREAQLRHALQAVPGVTFLAQPELRGTAAAVHQALAAAPDAPVLVLYGDVLFVEEDVRALLQAPCEIAAALLTPLHGESTRDWLCANCDRGRLTEISAHPRRGYSHRFAGAFLLRPSEVAPYLEKNSGRMTAIEVGMMAPDEAHLEESLHMALQDGWEVTAVEAAGPCIDIDKPWQLFEANQKLVNRLAGALRKNSLAKGAKISPQAHIDGCVQLGENSEIGPGCFIKGNLIAGKNTTITDGAIIEGHCIVGDHTSIRQYCQIMPGSSIGSHCVIGHGAEFGGVMMDRAYSFHYGEYWGVLGTACDLGAATVCGNLRFDDDLTVHRVQGRRERPAFAANGAYLGDYVRTGVNSIIMPGVKVGPYSVLGAGAVINEDVPENTLVYVEQHLVHKKWGPEKYGW